MKESKRKGGRNGKPARWQARLLSCLLGIALLTATGCNTQSETRQGQAEGEFDASSETLTANSPASTMGRYVEKEIAWTEGGGNWQAAAIIPEEKGLYLPNLNYRDARLKLEGADFSGEQEAPVLTDIDSAELPAVLREHMEAEDYITDMAMAENGARMYSIFSSSETEENVFYHDIYFLDAQGNESLWNAEGSVGRSDMSFLTCGDDGYFYVMSRPEGEEGKNLYRVDAESRETKYLMNLGRVWYISVFGGRLFAEAEEGIQIYDLATLEKLEEDKGLTELVKERLGVNNGNYARGYLLAPGEDDSIYVVTDKGLYRHVLYGNVSECLIEGALCSLGDISKLFTALYVAEADESGMPVFYILYDNQKLMRFAYDPQMPTVPEKTITLYSLNENGDIRLAISAYQLLHPDTYVRYEIGMSGEDGVTREDALNSLATRIASGEGPDILLMDNLPLRAYAQKGVLMDLSGVYGELKNGQNYFDNIINALYMEDKLYTIPMMFSVPMLAGDAEVLERVTDAESMVKAIEDYSMSESALKAGLLEPETVLQCMSYTNNGNWLKEDGSLDREALAEFLALSKRLYEADRADISQEDLEYRMSIVRSYTGPDRLRGYRTIRGMGNVAMNRIVYGDAFAIGTLGGNISADFNFFYAVLKQAEGEEDYMLLPGEDRNCLPAAMLAINAATPFPDAAQDFVKYTLSDYLEEAEYLTGTPISRDVLLAMEQNPYLNESDPMKVYTSYAMGYEGEDGMEIISTEVTWQEEAVYEKYNALLDSLDSVNWCEYELLDAVLDIGASALTGEKSIEETVDEIAQRVQIYLAE